MVIEAQWELLVICVNCRRKLDASVILSRMSSVSVSKGIVFAHEDF